MPKYTEHYKLLQPYQEEFYNIDEFNDNMDIIDRKLHELSQKSDIAVGADEPETATIWIDTDEYYEGGGGGSSIITLSSPPTSATVGSLGQQAIFGSTLYACVGSAKNGTTTEYIWVKIESTKATVQVITIEKSQTIDLANYGVALGDSIVVACVSGGCGGKSTSQAQGGRAGFGGGAVKDITGGGGGAGGGWGGGGGGAASGSSDKGGDGGQAGNCDIKSVTIVGTTIVNVTIGSGGNADQTGGSTSFGTYLSVAGGGGSLGGKGWDGGGGGKQGGGGGGGGWLFEGGEKLTQMGDGKDASGHYGGAGGGFSPPTDNSEGYGNTAGLPGGDAKKYFGEGVVIIWY